MAKSAAPSMPAALLAAIHADPDSDAPRQVIADALLERGDPRGEFIAVQLEIARRGGIQTAKTKKLWDRFRALHSGHAAKWGKPLRALGKSARWELHRGFVRRLRLAAPVPADALAAVLAIEPVTQLELDRVPVKWTESVLPQLERLRRLAILSVDTHSTAQLATSLAEARLPTLVELRVGLFDDHAVRALVATKALPALTHLALGCGGHGVSLSAPALTALARSALGQRLVTLELGRCAVKQAMREAVIAMPLERFSASSGEVHGDTDAAKPAAALAELAARFGPGFVVEDESSFDYLLDGVTKLSKLPAAWTGKS